MDSARQEATPPPTGSRWLAWPTALVPGLGPLIRGEVSLGIVFLACHLWLRLMLAGMAPPAERVDAFLLGAFGPAGGLRNPTFVFVTMLVVGTHLLAVAAWRNPRAGKRKEA